MTKPQLKFNLKYLPYIVIWLLVIIFAFMFRLKVLDKPATRNINTSSSLMEIINISELSTAEFQYKGIADVYKDEEKTKILCRICYKATVKAGINMDDVTLDIDTDNKTVTATLPDVDINVTIIDEGEDSMALLPSDAKVDIDKMLKCCKEDAEDEAKNSEELFATAEKNLKLSIEGLLFPILKTNGYSLVWK